MALKSTIFKAELSVSDMDRHYYDTHQLTIARHPSENDERMMMRILAFALNASETLAFGRGLSNEDEPDLWQKSLIDEIELWIEFGQPDEKRIRKACNQSQQVKIYTYQPRAAEVWWQQNKDKLAMLDKLSIFSISQESVDALASMAQRSMQLQCSIDDGQCWFSNGVDNVEIDLSKLK
jgi:uncharacterized protein YaeQ